MKSSSNLKLLIQDITRALSSNETQAAPLREHNILRSFTPKNMVRPFKDLPNVSSLWVRPNQLDPLLAGYDLASRLNPEMTYEEYSWRTKAANRYLRIMYYKMERLLCSGEHGKYWVYCLNLMLKSRVIRAVALRKLDRNWHRNFKLSTVKNLLRRLDEMLFEMTETLSIKRTYAVKSMDSEGKITNWRPIGNPDYPDRMYLYIWQSFFVIYVNSFISEHQHAYRPGQGVATALKEVKEIIENPDYTDIHEFDLKGAFPSVAIKPTCEALTACGFPIQLGNFLLNLSSKTIEMVDRSKQKLPEEKFDRQENIHRGLIGGFDELNPLIKEAKEESLKETFWTASEPWARNPAVNKKVDTFWSTDPADQAAEEEDEELQALLNQTRNRWGFESSVRKFAMQPVSILVPNESEVPMHLRGFPQGSAWSPVLFNFAFEYAALRGHFESISPTCRLISYADDFLAALKRKATGIMRESTVMLKFGLKFNHDKSRPLKVDGKWVVSEFKFLGVTFHVSNEKAIIVEGTPRSGKTLEFDKMEMVEQFKSRDASLRKIARALNPESPSSPQNLLDTWGRGEAPGNIIPDSIIKGERKPTKRLINRLREVAAKASNNAIEAANFSESETNLFNKIREGSNLNWLGMRKAGLILNRLHGGSWTPHLEPSSRSLDSPKSTRGRSLLELHRATEAKFFSDSTPNSSIVKRAENIFNENAVLDLQKAEAACEKENLMRDKFLEKFPLNLRDKALSIWNSTSLATKVSLNLLKNPKSVKIRRQGIQYK